MEHLFLTKSYKKGFTLLEVLIVIAIIGILVTIGLASYSSAQKKSRDARRRGDVKAMQNGWEQYYADNSGAYPTSCSFATVSTYLPTGLPTDPQTGNAYCVDANLSTTSYRFCAQLESSTTGNADASGTYGAGTTHYCVSQLQ